MSFKPSNVTLFLLSIVTILIISCNKNETTSKGNSSKFTNLYSKGGIVHNELLGVFARKLSAKTEVMAKLNAIAVKYDRLATTTVPRSLAPISTVPSELQTEVYSVVSQEVLPIAVNYLRDNSIYQQMEQVGIQEPELLVDEIIANFENNISLTPQQSLARATVDKSLSLQSFANDL